ncbi:unnamed protein product [Closterium sp. Naga37s-1]|nr:unnamed protein product [Closterium sp. Naga37s-1]
MTRSLTKATQYATALAASLLVTSFIVNISTVSFPFLPFVQLSLPFPTGYSITRSLTEAPHYVAALADSLLVFSIATDGQTQVGIKVLLGEREMASDLPVTTFPPIYSLIDIRCSPQRRMGRCKRASAANEQTQVDIKVLQGEREMASNLPVTAFPPVYSLIYCYRVFSTAADGQTQVGIKVLQGEREMAAFTYPSLSALIIAKLEAELRVEREAAAHMAQVAHDETDRRATAERGVAALQRDVERLQLVGALGIALLDGCEEAEDGGAKQLHRVSHPIVPEGKAEV